MWLGHLVVLQPPWWPKRSWRLPFFSGVMCYIVSGGPAGASGMTGNCPGGRLDYRLGRLYVTEIVGHDDLGIDQRFRLEGNWDAIEPTLIGLQSRLLDARLTQFVRDSLPLLK